MYERNRKIVYSGWISAIAFGVCLSSSNAASLCEPQEKVLFSCALKNTKTVAICMADGEKEKYVEYKFGKPKKIELTHRADHQTMNHAFQRADILYGNNAVDTIWFQNGDHLYDVSMPARGAPAVEVWKNEKILAHMKCAAGWKNVEGDIDLPSPFVVNHGNMDVSDRNALWFKR